MNTQHTNVAPLFLIPRYWPSTGGAELHTRELARQLHLKGRVGVLHHCADEPLSIELAFSQATTQTRDDAGVAVYQVGAHGALRWLLQQLAARHAQRRWTRPLYAMMFKHMLKSAVAQIAQHYQLIHAVYNGLTPSAELAADVCQSLGLPFVWTPLAHTTLPSGTGWSSKAFRRLYARADALIAMTEYERHWLIEQGADAERVHVCPVSTLLAGEPDPKQFRDIYQLGESPIVLFLGRLVDYKGYRQLCDAAQQVWQTVPETQFLFVGPITPESQQWFANRPDPRLRVMGLLSDYDKTSALAACEVLCVPSTEESLGVTYLEAWTLEKPVVAADIPVLRTVIDHGGDGLLTEPHGEAIAQALLHLLGDEERRRTMGLRGAQKVKAYYNWAHLADRLATIHRSVVDAYEKDAKR